MHKRQKFFAGGGRLHRRVNIVDEREFPPVSFERRAVFPRADRLASRVFYERFQNGKMVFYAKLVADLSHFFDRVRTENDLAPGLELDGIDDEMIVNATRSALVFRVEMRGDQDFTAREKPFGKRKTDAVRLVKIRDLPRGEGLNVLIKPPSLCLPVQIFGREKFFERDASVAIDARKILPSVLVHGLVFL